MATIPREATTGAVECICFRFEKHADVIRDDAIVKVVGNFEVNARGNQIVVGRIEELQVEAFEANVAPRAPSQLQLRVPSAEVNQTTSRRLTRILQAYPPTFALQALLLRGAKAVWVRFHANLGHWRPHGPPAAARSAASFCFHQVNAFEQVCFIVVKCARSH